MPFYSCHTLATEAAGKKIFTVEGLGDEKNLHRWAASRLQHMAADCGFVQRAGKSPRRSPRQESESTVDEVKAALAGHICRCAAYSAIVSTVIDAGRVLRGEPEATFQPHTESVIQIKLPMRDFSDRRRPWAR